MGSMKQVWRAVAFNFYGWNKNPRVIMTFVLAFVLCLLLTDKSGGLRKPVRHHHADHGNLRLDVRRRGLHHDDLFVAGAAVCGYAVFECGNAVPAGSHQPHGVVVGAGAVRGAGYSSFYGVYSDRNGNHLRTHILFGEHVE